jgi:hypothetical protein
MDSASIKVTDKVVIRDLEVKDSQVVAAVTAAQADGKDLGEFLTHAIEIGVKALLATGVSIGVEALTDEIGRTKTELSQAGKNLMEQLATQMKAVAGEGGTLEASIENLLEGFTDELGRLTSGENSPIQEGLKTQLKEVASRLVDDFTRVTNNQKTEIAQILDPKNPTSPLRSIAEGLERVDRGLNSVKEEMVKEIAVAEAVENTPVSGLPYEDQVNAVLKRIAGFVGDLCTPTGQKAGLAGKNNYKGDAVIELRQGDRNIARIVAESKNSALDMNRWKAEYDGPKGAKANRDALSFIGFVKKVSDMPNANRIYMIDRLTWLVAFDPEVDSPEIAMLVYQMLKTNTLAAAGNLDETEINTINVYIAEALEEVKKIDTMVKNVGQIKNLSTAMHLELASVRNAIINKLKSIQTTMSPGKEDLSLSLVAPLELE